jgi:hypothetical protein
MLSTPQRRADWPGHSGVLGIHAGGRRIEDTVSPPLVQRVQHVQIDRYGIVYHVGIVLAGEDIASPAHIGRHLLNLGERAIDDRAAKRLLTQIADGKIVGFGVSILAKLEINAAYPKSLFQPLHEMTTDKAPGRRKPKPFSSS